VSLFERLIVLASVTVYSTGTEGNIEKHVASVGEERRVNRVLVGKLEGLLWAGPG